MLKAAQSNIFIRTDDMTVCNVKGVTLSEEPTESDRLPCSLQSLGVFQILGVFWPTTLRFRLSLTALIQLIFQVSRIHANLSVTLKYILCPRLRDHHSLGTMNMRCNPDGNAAPV